MKRPDDAGERGPSRRDIRAACEEIQAKWSDVERRKRAGLPKRENWIPPVVHIRQVGLEFEVEAET